MFQSLCGSLQASIRFPLHPLPSIEFRPCCLGPTRSYRPLLDSVGPALSGVNAELGLEALL
jgi:hypothetical protein